MPWRKNTEKEETGDLAHDNDNMYNFKLFIILASSDCIDTLMDSNFFANFFLHQIGLTKTDWLHITEVFKNGNPLGKGCKKKGEEDCFEITVFIVFESGVLFEGSFRICLGHGRKGDVMYHLDGQVCIKFGVLSTPLFSYNQQNKK